MARRLVLKVMKAVAVIAGIVFWFTPLHTGMQVLVFAGSIIVFIVCCVISGDLDNKNTGYWPGGSGKE